MRGDIDRQAIVLDQFDVLQMLTYLWESRFTSKYSRT